jgi:hypothetical protein
MAFVFQKKSGKDAIDEKRKKKKRKDSSGLNELMIRVTAEASSRLSDFLLHDSQLQPG